MLLILLSLLTFLHRLEDVPGLCPTTQLAKPQSREPRFLPPSRKRVDHCPISISPPRRPVLLQPRARRPEEAGRPEATLQPEAPSELRGRGGGGREEASARSVRPARSPPAGSPPAGSPPAPRPALPRASHSRGRSPGLPSSRPLRSVRPSLRGLRSLVPLPERRGRLTRPRKKKDPISQHYWISNVGCDGAGGKYRTVRTTQLFPMRTANENLPRGLPLTWT